MDHWYELVGGIMNYWIFLKKRRVIRVAGEKHRNVLQKLITQDVTLLERSDSVFSAMLTEEGRFYCDFFLVREPKDLGNAANRLGENTLVDCSDSFFEDIWKTLLPFAKEGLKLEDATKEYAVCCAIGPEVLALLGVGEKPDASKLRSALEHRLRFFVDPRDPSIGVRALVPYEHLSYLPSPLLALGKPADYQRHCILQGIPDGDGLVPHHSCILDFKYHDLHAVSWTKESYRGSGPLSAHYARKVSKGVYVLSLQEGQFPSPGTELRYHDKVVGFMGNACEHLGLAALSRQHWGDFDNGCYRFCWGENAFCQVSFVKGNGIAQAS